MHLVVLGTLFELGSSVPGAILVVGLVVRHAVEGEIPDVERVQFSIYISQLAIISPCVFVNWY